MQATCHLLLLLFVSAAPGVHCLNKAPSLPRGEALEVGTPQRAVEHASEWKIAPDSNVTFNSMFCCQDHARVENVLTSLSSLQFCFSGVFLVVDVPHNGSIDKDSEELIRIVKRTAGEAAELISQHCLSAPKPVARVHVVDYGKGGGGTGAALLSKALHPGQLCDLRQSLVDQAYKNTVPYLVSLLQSGTQYVFHTDADVQVLRTRGTLSFMDESLRLLRDDWRVVATSPAPPDDDKCSPIERDSERDPYYYHPYCPWHDAEAFLVDTFKLDQLFPLLDPCNTGGTQMENLLARNLVKTHLREVLFDRGFADVEYSV